MDKSFYDCIQQQCLENASRCLEGAKANESIAYLRFWYKDPRADLEHAGNESENEQDEDEDEDDDSSKANSDRNGMDIDSDSVIVIKEEDDDRIRLDSRESSTSSATSASSYTLPLQQSPRTFELEAVVSCTSDGLVVVLRRARPPIPDLQPVVPSAFNYQNGLFAAPWAQQPIEPYIPPDLLYTFRPPFLPQYMPLRESVKAAGGPPIDHLMRSIRDVAVFAWALSGINGNLANYGHGMPRRGAQPPDGLPVWDPNGNNNQEQDKAYGANHHPLAGAPHGYTRTRHASLDEAMYGNHQHQARASWSPPAAAPSPYRYGGGYDASQQQLRSTSSYNTLQHHIPQQHHQHQQHQRYYSPQPAAVQPGPARCQLQPPQWGEPSSSRPSSITTHGPLPPNTGEPSASTRYFWQ
ncbi:hypothetical protein B0T21DRAFT_289891 [Apiosordaria backusii]|uniref:Uncharacterized protein n=1 Tax=Apiosordaria backusii TaxID=314023 RepID=A0AA40BKH7_9PEZI|nr:hypothetical protein B0T21DRAFT_289891 [Apiosordaria backusii]